MQTKNSTVRPGLRCPGVDLVDQAQRLQPVDHSDDFTQALSVDAAVNLAGRIAYAEQLRVSAGRPPRIGLIFDDGRDFLVYGEWLYSLDELRLHGASFAFDRPSLAYVAKYLRKAVQP